MTKLKNNVAVYKVGGDGGNSKIKIVYNDQYTEYDNIYAPNTKLDYSSQNFTDDEMDEYLRDILSVKFTWHNGQPDERTEDFLFGNITSAKKSNIEERINADKSDDLMLVMNTILCSVNFIIENMDEKELTKEMEMNIDFSTGLPYHEYKIEQLRNKYAKHYIGQHVIEFQDPRYRCKVEKVTVNILDDVNVESEGLCALKTILQMQDIVNEDTEELYMDTLWTLIDIGGYTTDIMGGIFKKMKQGMKLQTYDSLGKGISMGVSTAQDLAIEKINAKYRTKYASFNINRAEINDAEKRKGEYKGRINKYKLNSLDYTTEEYQKLGRAIGNDYIQLYIENGRLAEIERVYIAGGGALNDIIVNALTEELISRGIEKEKIEVINDPNPIYLNAVGYYLS